MSGRELLRTSEKILLAQSKLGYKFTNQSHLCEALYISSDALKPPVISPKQAEAYANTFLDINRLGHMAFRMVLTVDGYKFNKSRCNKPPIP
ncbi:hypothetical protein BO70DRAFT_357811 [Aspergillus heteromorphus CBS 117.55]|uniref:Uncharacterized protein n=1 Tax=Aspergillus heteromorphus CBS 117.55 TaxID=1448321 RepID=A0A317X547_9EURO|nr:uncharacterized protein BO70DRAFT_357811 [Aspergillus heteromorphus CBS 117.55]PWY92667.1 hypothetical protein BO70DRAFT_357811 [Aspergillus heteromorphus CBS 117.55]